MAEGPAGDQRGVSMDTEQDLLLQREQPGTPKGSRGTYSPSSSSAGAASLSLAAPAPGARNLGELPRQERRRIEQETNKPRVKPGESLSESLLH